MEQDTTKRELNTDLGIDKLELPDIDSEPGQDTEPPKPTEPAPEQPTLPQPAAGTEMVALSSQGLQLVSGVITTEGLIDLMKQLLKDKDVRRLLNLNVSKEKKDKGAYIG